MQNKCQDLPEISEGMKSVLQKVEQHKLPKPEKTFFSIIGNRIGDLEVPTTKLLQFFMDPKGGHDLGPLFLNAFFGCLKNDCDNIACDDAHVEPNQTDEGKFPDLVMSGTSWALVVENKIRAQLYNDLVLYAKHAERYFPKKEKFLAILSPRKQDEKPTEWKSVTYKDYCNALKRELAKAVLERPISKWQVFARELIVHLENAPDTLCNPTIPMKPETTQYVEANLREIRSLQELTDCYRENLGRELTEHMQKAVSKNRQFVFYERDSRWAFECDEYIGAVRLNFHFQTALHKKLDGDKTFAVNVWIGNLTDAQLKHATECFSNGCSEKNGWWIYRCEQFFDKREDAISAICELAKKVLDFFGNEAPAPLVQSI